MTTRKKWIIIGTIIIVLLAIFLHSCKSGSKNSDQETVTVKKGNIDEKVIAVGNIMPKHTISVKSIIPGIVGKLFHEEGDYVDQGALIIQVSPAPTPQLVAEANAAVKEQDAIVKQAEDHQKRLEKLVKTKIITPDAYAMAVKDVSTAKAKMEMAEQKLALMQNGEATIGGKNIKTTINSPISGYILQRNVDVGDPVVPLTEAQAGTVLFVIANMQDLIFKGTVNEIDVAKISPNMVANISIAALPDTSVQGTLSKVGLRSNTPDTNRDTQTNNNTSTNNSPFNVGFNVELTNLQLPKNIKLRSGYSATAEITVKRVENVLVIPERVLVFKDNKTYVNLPGKKPKQQEIKTGISDGINVEILAGLSEGQEILDNNVATKAS